MVRFWGIVYVGEVYCNKHFKHYFPFRELNDCVHKQKEKIGGTTK